MLRKKSGWKVNKNLLHTLLTAFWIQTGRQLNSRTILSVRVVSRVTKLYVVGNCSELFMKKVVRRQSLSLSTQHVLCIKSFCISTVLTVLHVTYLNLCSRIKLPRSNQNSEVQLEMKLKHHPKTLSNISENPLYTMMYSNTINQRKSQMLKSSLT